MVRFTLLRTYEWTEQNDPVMGGRSSGNWSVVDDYGVFQGTTRIVPSLKGVCVCVCGTARAHTRARSSLLAVVLPLARLLLQLVRLKMPERIHFFFGAGKEDNQKKKVYVDTERCSGFSTCTEHASKSEVGSGAYAHKRHYKTRTHTAPGFCNSGTTSVFKDDAGEYVSGALQIMARTTTPSYAGFRISIGAVGIPHHKVRSHMV
jgi:hypothetical protein